MLCEYDQEEDCVLLQYHPLKLWLSFQDYVAQLLDQYDVVCMTERERQIAVDVL